MIAMALLGMGCSRPDPALQPVAKALVLWEEGERLLAAGDATGAAEKFRAAHVASPAPLLAAWEGKALAAAGDLPGAVARLDAALEGAPRLAEARYNRAAYLVRLGRAEEAAKDLETALLDGDIRSITVLEDTDFAGVLDHPAFAFLPRTALAVAIDPPPETAFWGAEVALGIRLIGLVRPPVVITPERATGPLELVSVTEDTLATSLGPPGLHVVYTWRVTGAGPVEIGPFDVRAGRYSATSGVVKLMAAAPEGKEGKGMEPLHLTLPSEWEQRVPTVGAKRIDGDLIARGEASDRVTTVPELPPPIRYERLEHGRSATVLWRWPGAPAATVRIVDRSGNVRFED